MATPAELEAQRRQRELLAMYGPTPQERSGEQLVPRFETPREQQRGFIDLPPPDTESASSNWVAGFGPFRAMGDDPPPLPASQVPEAFGPRFAPQAPAPEVPPLQGRPFAMPTQEGHTEPPPLVLDERVNPPTPTEQQGLEGSIVGTMWNDPIALAGYGRDVVRWGERPVGGLDVIGQYAHPRHPRNRAEGTADTIRFQPGIPASPRRPVPLNYNSEWARDYAAQSSADFPEMGRHEFRHRGFHNMGPLARAYGLEFNAAENPNWLDEMLNIYADRDLGTRSSYQNTRFGPREALILERQLRNLRGLADDVNARRVQRMYDTGESWTQTGRTME